MFLVLPIDSLVFCLLAQEKREREKRMVVVVVGWGSRGRGGVSALTQGARGLNEQQQKKRKYVFIKM